MVPVISALIAAFVLGFLLCSMFAAGADGLRHGEPRGGRRVSKAARQ